MLSIKVMDMENENEKLKKEIETLKMRLGETPVKQTCEFCRNFRQHYIKSGGSYIAVCSGHCTCLAKRGGKKGKNPNDTCQYYERKSGNEPWIL